MNTKYILYVKEVFGINQNIYMKKFRTFYEMERENGGSGTQAAK